DWSGLHVSVLANVYVLSLTAARFFHTNNIPGVTVTDDLLALIEKQVGSSDKGKTFFLEFAAKQCAIAKGLGFRGVYLGGHLKASDYKRVLEIADQFGEDDWQDFAKEICFSQTDEFYFFEPDIATKLSSTEINREYLHSKHLKASQVSRQKVPLGYKINRTIHDIAFKKGTVGFGLGEKISRAIERKNKGAQKIFHGLEQTFKIAAFDCQDCGDCSLPDIAFLCPESQCVKNQRNGPCGGTKQGKCEVGEKECIWSLAYDRLKAYDQEEPMLDGPVVFRNGALKGTSAWINTFLGRDHHGKDKK
ncbi:MAG: methylenetetrahydrofolate reductase C-terminal domain-containing protein, partial [Candidatus Poribacteria bacterium]|nr:methylenetetrahydrofolate reductase C-terminal domain-containing protein [Candidatus Poribacteria bacterium]